MGDRAPQRVEPSHHLLDSLLARKRLAEKVPIRVDDLAKLSKSREVDRDIGLGVTAASISFFCLFSTSFLIASGTRCDRHQSSPASASSVSTINARMVFSSERTPRSEEPSKPPRL